MIWYAGGNNQLSLELTNDQVHSVPRSGPADHAVARLSLDPGIKAQLEKLDPAMLAEELSEYGAWSDKELANHGQNLQRILWIAVGDLRHNAE